MIGFVTFILNIGRMIQTDPVNLSQKFYCVLVLVSSVFTGLKLKIDNPTLYNHRQGIQHISTISNFFRGWPLIYVSQIFKLNYISNSAMFTNIK